MKILVTGGAGYIGSHITQLLTESGFEVVIFDNLSTGFKNAISEDAYFFEGDVRDTEKLISVLINESIDAVIHLAAKLILLESIKDPLLYYGNNTLGVLSLVQACRKAQVDKIIFSSSASVYGESQSSLLTENSPISPITPYGWSKLFSEQILKESEVSCGIRSVSLRYFNAAGASLNLSNGQRSSSAGHLIKVCAEAACKKRNHVEIFGDNYPTPDGTGVRDFIHVQDLANLHVQSLKYLINGGRGEILNCGYGKGHSVLEVIKTMQAISGVEFMVKKSPRREGDSSCLIADSTKARKLFGWTPEFDSLTTICKTAYEWEKKL